MLKLGNFESIIATKKKPELLYTLLTFIFVVTIIVCFIFALGK